MQALALQQVFSLIDEDSRLAWSRQHANSPHQRIRNLSFKSVCRQLEFHAEAKDVPAAAQAVKHSALGCFSLIHSFVVRFPHAPSGDQRQLLPPWSLRAAAVADHLVQHFLLLAFRTDLPAKVCVTMTIAEKGNKLRIFKDVIYIYDVY